MKYSRLTIIILALFVLALITTMLTSCTQGESQSTLQEECVRIHIRANSNSEKDQSIKLKVRDNITQYLSSRLDGCASKSEALATLNKEKDKLTNIANSTLECANYNYKASIVIKQEYFPNRKYGEYAFPEGVYDALIIYLGEGNGDNWWCVAFPPLCFIPDSDGEQIVYKSWIKEWFDKIFG